MSSVSASATRRLRQQQQHSLSGTPAITPARQHIQQQHTSGTDQEEPTTNKSSSSSENDNVRVAVRIRPLNPRERAAGVDSRYTWVVKSDAIAQHLNGKAVSSNTFSFDNIFQHPADNQVIFQNVARPVVSSAVQGINGVIFAYGQTAAGKTHTMLGNEIDPGVTPRSIQAVFEAIAQCTNRQFLLRATYIEIYNEVIRDLLFPMNDNLKIHEDAINKRVFVDAKEQVVTSVQQVMDIIAAGEQVRAVGETNMNDRSSRSHTIFSLKIESREMTAADARQRRRTLALENGTHDDDEDDEEDEDDNANEGVAVCASTLSLVDLAGSERASFTKAQGMRLVEGGHINKSLLTLGNVINKLSSADSKSRSNLAHIPYRDSKLTRLLQPALGGNARTAIICAVTPAILHMEETLSTLKFASRAKKVTNSAKTNEFLDDRAKLCRAQRLIADLKRQLQNANMGKSSLSPRRLSMQSTDANSPTLRKRTSSSLSAVTVKKRNEKRFERLLDAIVKGMGKSVRKGRNSDSVTQMLAPSPPRKRRRISGEVSLRAALDLMPVRRRRSLNRKGKMIGVNGVGLTESDDDDDDDGTEDCDDELNENIAMGNASSRSGRRKTLSKGAEKEMADLRRRAFEAERQLRVASAEIAYERDAMQREVSELVLTAEEASRHRDLAERDCADMHHRLSLALSKSLVDEVVSNAMDRSHLQSQLRGADKKLKCMESIKNENDTHKTTIISLRKEVAEFTRREKRGIGPVMKECKKAQSQLADVEAKLRAQKQTSTHNSSEKARLERELKAKERQLKMLTTRVEQQNKRDESKVQAKVQREVSKIQKKADNEIANMKVKIEGVQTETKEANTKLENTKKELTEKINVLETTTKQLETARTDLTEANTCLSTTEAQLDMLQEGLRQEREAKEKTEGELKTCRERVEKCDLEIRDLTISLMTEREKVKLLEKERDEARTEVGRFVTRVAELEAKVQEGRLQIEKLQGEIASTFADASKWEAKAANDTKRLESERQKREQSEREIQNIRDRLEKAELCSVEMEVSKIDAVKELKEKLQLMEEELVKLKSQEKENNALLRESARHARAITEEVEEQKKIVKQLEKKKEELNIELRDAEERFSESNAVAEDLREALSVAREETERERQASVSQAKQAELELNALRERVSIAEDETQAAREKCEVLEKQLEVECSKAHESFETVNRFKAREDELRQKIEEIQTALEECKMEHREALETNSQLRAEDVKLTKEQRRLLGALKDRDHRIAELEETINAWKCGEGEIARLKERIARRNDKIYAMNKDIDRLRKQLTSKDASISLIELERISQVESLHIELTAERDRLAQKVEQLEQTAQQTNRQILRLRERIKNDDIRRVDQLIKFKTGDFQPSIAMRTRSSSKS